MTRTTRIAAVAYGLAAYVSFVASIGYLIAFLAELGVPKSVSEGAGPLGPAWLIDILLIAAFGVQHSIMARPGFKRRLTRVVPPQLERSTFVLTSGLMLALLFWLWRPLPAPVWELSGQLGASALWVIYGLAWAVAVSATFALDHAYLLGLTQVAAYVEGRDSAPAELRTPGLYRIVRHPMTAALILAFWATPRMTLGHLLLATGMTAYSLIGTYFEERDLVRALGERYRAYRRRVPALVPLPRPGSGSRRLRRAGIGVGALLILIALLAAAGSEHETNTREPAAISALPGRLVEAAMQIAGRERRFTYYVPERDARRPPLVLAFHGSGGSGERLRGFLGGELERLAERHGFIAVYPQGFEGSWNGCRGPAPSRANRLDIDDVAFVRAIIERLTEELDADRSRVYAIGFSGGGHMAYRLALEVPEEVPAVVAIAANLPVEEEIDCRPSGKPVSVMIVNGTADPVNPYGGGEVVAPAGAHLGRVRSARRSAAYFAELAGYDRAPTDTVTPLPELAGGTGVEVAAWRGSGDTEIALYTIHGGGHTIPGPRSHMPDLLGPTERRYNALEKAVTFFVAASQLARAGAR